MTLRGYLNLSDVAAEPRPLTRLRPRSRSRAWSWRRGSGSRASVYGSLVDDQRRRSAVPPRPLGDRGPSADADGGQRARAPLRELACSTIAPGSPRWPVATKPPRRTSTRHGAWWRSAAATSTRSPRAIAAAEMARARGDSRHGAGRGAASPRPRDDHRAGAALRWPLVWLGLRVEAEAPEPAPDSVAALLAMAGELPATTPLELAHRALADGRGREPRSGLGRR